MLWNLYNMRPDEIIGTSVEVQEARSSLVITTGYRSSSPADTGAVPPEGCSP